MLYFSQLSFSGGKTVLSQPGYQAAEIRISLASLNPAVAEPDASVGCGRGDCTSEQKGEAQTAEARKRKDRRRNIVNDGQRLEK